MLTMTVLSSNKKHVEGLPDDSGARGDAKILWDFGCRTSAGSREDRPPGRHAAPDNLQST
ncbi:MAG: hypothetical protein M0C28_36090 [Candidatus Moduliflexus flocculans]|nr:hypothetical protein [Candidatus Moduliflexus flocculans]